jgi:hypothetical protein
MLKTIEYFWSTFDLNGYAVAIVQDKPGQSSTHCLSIDKWPEANTLDNA